MAVSLLDIVKNSRDPVQKGFILDLLRYSDLTKAVMFKDIPNLKVVSSRWNTIPASGFRSLNGGYTESTGNVEEVHDTLALLGGDVKIDKVGELADAFEKPLATQMKMKAKSVAFTFNDTFINGDHGLNPDQFEGIKKRVSNMPARQTIDLAVATVSFKVLASNTNEKIFLDALHQGIKVVDGATHIFCNEQTYLKFGSLLRDLGLVYGVKELYDQKWETFAGVPLVDVGLKSDKTSEIILNTEDPGNATLDSTSLYLARMDSDDGLSGIQLKGMGLKVYDPLNGNETEVGPQYLRRIDWAVGLQSPSNYSICRIKGFKMAAS